MDVYIVPVVGPVVSPFADWEVRKADDAPTGGDPDWNNGEPLFGPASDEECMTWCAWRGYPYRHRKYVSTVVPKNFDDLARRCDDAYRIMHEHADKVGWTFRSDCTYRGMPGWFCYTGDLGGRASFDGVDEKSWHTDHGQAAAAQWNYLTGMSDAVWELGFVLVFNSDGNHMVMGRNNRWVTLDGDD